MKYLFTCSLLCIGVHLIAQTNQWVKTSFPDSNLVYCIKSLEGHLLAGSHTGLFQSTDNGINWDNLTAAYGIVTVNDIVKYDTLYYVSTWSSGIWTSPDLTVWTAQSSGLPEPLHVTSLCVTGDKIYAGTSNSVYVWNNLMSVWMPDGLQVNIPHNDYILDLYAPDQNTLYASGCDYLYRKTGGMWQIIDTSYQFCGMQIGDDGQNLYVNTSGSGIQKFGSGATTITETILPNIQDPTTWSASDIRFNNGLMYVLSKQLLYYPQLDSVENVCSDLLNCIEFGMGKIFIGTQRLGIWTKTTPGFEPPGNEERSAKNYQTTLNVSPVPSDGYSKFEIGMEQDHLAQLQVFDATGKMIYMKDVNSDSVFDFYFNAPGLYMVVLQSDSSKIVKRVIIQ